ncbi:MULTISPECIES: TIGR03619 family F420-dependent LLM class oxidoreductase [unclassified Blastococcus]|uniref:TIGR03619 family F420-dependent LLM class oxidoreductase n=1 Tax=unclassified Blastococcus TaxID=2619396 RepID=UPI001EF09BC1|nr:MULTISPECIES: TIGR03619 family F420-dependent LLM class oxidoreductase [unclassified Blastococcus]
MRIGAKVPSSGPLPVERGIGAMARTLEDAGFASLWVSDHVVLPGTIRSHYPFTADGRATWDTHTPYFDALVALTLAAAATRRASLGTAVLVLPLRAPLVLAKQAASLDVLSGGRLRLGVGAGWLREEFHALGVPFGQRGARLEEWIAILRDCWTGAPAARRYEHYEVPEDVLCLPRPAGPVPLLVGGHSPVALGRAGRLAEGWLAQQSLDALDVAELAAGREAVHHAAAGAGRQPAATSVVLRLVDSAGRSDEVARRLPELAAAGVDEVVVDVDWADDGDPGRAAARLLEAAGP